VLGFLNIDSTWNLQRGKYATIFTKVSDIKVFGVNNSGPLLYTENVRSRNRGIGASGAHQITIPVDLRWIALFFCVIREARARLWSINSMTLIYTRLF